MPNFDIIKTSEIENSFRNKSIIDTYELNIKKVTEKFKGNLDIDNKKWNIGLIVGRSGTGKTTVAKECFSEYYFEDFEWDNKSVIENMPKDIELSHITKIFNSVGFGTVWSWLKPYFVLSNGEKMRVNLARCILESQDKIVFDEFTSVVDRTIAKTASCALSKAIRKLDKQFIGVSCHKDIIEWLEPDWIYDTDKKKFFFVQKNTKDLNWKYMLEKPTEQNGNYLKSIII